ncbi:MAG: hypothetical protein COA47_10240 [Robiginitomaculum sp.]|nr:MAG: hypothetical protein COA47_10240 [Robiginitomaculum sp.]
MTNKYNLAEVVAAKTDMQILKMIKLRVQNEKRAYAIVSFFEMSLFDEYTEKTQKMLIKADSIVGDANDWLRDCAAYFAEEKWDDMILKSGSCLECHGWEALS